MLLKIINQKVRTGDVATRSASAFWIGEYGCYIGVGDHAVFFLKVKPAAVQVPQFDGFGIEIAVYGHFVCDAADVWDLMRIGIETAENHLCHFLTREFVYDCFVAEGVKSKYIAHSHRTGR